MSIGLLFFLLAIIVMNVIVGYAVGVLCGIGPPDFPTALKVLAKRHHWAENLLVFLKGKCVRFTMWLVPWKKLLSSVNFFRKNKGTQPHHIAKEEQLQIIAKKEVGELLEDEETEITRITPIPELFDDQLTNIILMQKTEDWQAIDKSIETSLKKLNLIMMQSGEYAAKIDEQLRAIQGKVDKEVVERICNDLIKDCENYLAAQSAITKEIHERVEEIGELRSLKEDVDFSNLEQTSQIESSINNLAQIIKSSEPEKAVELLLMEISNLRKARHRARDLQDMVFVTVAKHEERLDSLHRQQVFFDPMTELPNRIAFQTHLWEWWKQERQKKTKLTFGLYDIVNFSDLNNKIGIRNCDLILRAIHQILEEHVENKDFIGLYSGGCFVSVSTNSGLRKTVAVVERIRQMIEQVTFEYLDARKKTKRVDVGLRCVVTEATASQTVSELIACLDQTLAAAKKSEANTTFQLDCSVLAPKPEMVESPEFGLKKQTFNLNEMQIIE